MTTIRERLETGERWWAAECVLRAGGLGLLALAGWLATSLRGRLVTAGVRPAQFLLGLLAVVLLAAAMALVCEGPGLFRRMSKPPRALLP